MWALLPTRLQLLIIVGFALLMAWAFNTFQSWLGWSFVSTLGLASPIVLAITGILVPTLNALWRRAWAKWPLLERRTFPDLNGTWEGHLCTTWVNPETGSRPGPIPATIEVRQSLFTIAIRLKTAESKSHSTRCYLEADHAGQLFRVWYRYDNRPKAEVSFRSSRHEGFAWLEMELACDRDELVGQYYTERRTTGDMRFRRVPDKRSCNA